MTDNTSAILRRGWSVFGKLVAGTRKGPSGERVRQLKKLQKQIGVRFLDLSLLEQALTHRSYSHVTSRNRDASNERMEFLGDSVLGLAVSQFVYLQFPDRPEGALSKMKSLLVSRKVLSSVSRDAGLGEYILLSGEESEMGGRERESILSDVYEGVIGAIYLDQGYRAASRFIHDTLLVEINDILKDEEHTNYKSLLQEFVQSRRLSHPMYRVHAEQGPEHEKEFAVEVVVKGEVWGLGRGKNKKDAEQAAAREALESQRKKVTAPRSGRWRTSQGPAISTRAANEGAGPEAAAPVEGGRHGVRASRELLRAARQAQGKPEAAARPGRIDSRRGEERQDRREERRVERREDRPREDRPEGRREERREDRPAGDRRRGGRSFEDRRRRREERPDLRGMTETRTPVERVDRGMGERRPAEPKEERLEAPRAEMDAMHSEPREEPAAELGAGREATPDFMPDVPFHAGPSHATPGPAPGPMEVAHAPSRGRRGRRGGRGRRPGAGRPQERVGHSPDASDLPGSTNSEPIPERRVISPRVISVRMPQEPVPVEETSTESSPPVVDASGSTEDSSDGFAARRRRRALRGGSRRK
jgi:ribonuclease-3